MVIYLLQYGTRKTLAAWNQQNSCFPRWYHYCPTDIRRIESHRHSDIVLMIWSTDTPSLQLLHLGDRELYWRSLRGWAVRFWTCWGDCNFISSCKRCLYIQQNDIYSTLEPSWNEAGKWVLCTWVSLPGGGSQDRFIFNTSWPNWTVLLSSSSRVTIKWRTWDG